MNDMNKLLDTGARVISGLTFPLLMPTYALLLAFGTTFLNILPGRSVLVIELVAFGATVMIPIIAIYALNARGVIKDPLLNQRRDRTIPFVVTMLSYIGMAVYLWHLNAPVWMTGFMVGAAAVLLAMLFINLVWKISGHAAGMGGLTALAIFVVHRGYCIVPGVTLPCVLIVVSGIVCSSRLLLSRHTLSQVTAGYFLSLTVIYLSMLLAA